MKKTQELIQAFDLEYQDPKIELSVIKEEQGQGFTAKYSCGTVSLNANNSLGALYGLHQIQTAIRSDHLQDFLGENTPRFPLRPLRLSSSMNHTVSPNVSLSFPEILRTDQEIDQLCKMVIEFGYNAIILGSQSLIASNNDPIDLSRALACIKDFGIRLIVQPTLTPIPSLPTSSCCPLNPSFQDWVQRAITDLFHHLPEIDAILWKSYCLEPDYFNSEEARDATSADLVTSEVQLIENLLPEGASLIYHLPALDLEMAEGQSRWFSMFCDDVGPSTAIAFSSRINEQLLHPFWKTLRQCPDVSATPLIPMLQMDDDQAQLDQVQEVLARCRRHRFAGVIGQVNQLPEKADALHEKLWVLGQALWRDLPPQLLAETWAAAY